MDFRITLIILVIILIYTLYYTYNNDFGMFLYLILLLVAGLFIYEYIEYKIELISIKFDKTLSNIKYQIDNSLENLNFMIKSSTSLFNPNNKQTN